MTIQICVYVLEDHTIVREGVVAPFETTDDLVVVGQCSDGRRAVSEIESLEPDVVLCGPCNSWFKRS